MFQFLIDYFGGTTFSFIGRQFGKCYETLFLTAIVFRIISVNNKCKSVFLNIEILYDVTTDVINI